MPGPADPFEGSNFSVDIGNGPEALSRVELPVAVLDEVAHRSGADKSAEARKQPGLASYSHLVLSRGLTADPSLWQWWEAARSGDPTEVDRDVVVSLLDSEWKPRVRWRFRNAFPVVYRLTPLDALGSELVVETVELAFDTMDAEHA